MENYILIWIKSELSRENVAEPYINSLRREESLFSYGSRNPCVS
jgi:hypothetical protein